jgi:type IV pilus assembly protein PilW
MNSQRYFEQGFTLIELMISITLGLLITAAAVQMLITSSRSSTAQQAGSSMIGDEVFSLPILVESIRSSNYGAKAKASQTQYVMNETTPYGGIVLSTLGAATDPATQNLNAIVASAANFVTKGAQQTSNIVGQRSDQLTLQRFTDTDTIDCQGNSVPANRYIVERYFVAQDTSTNRAGEVSPLSLRCSAGSYTAADKTVNSFKLPDGTVTSFTNSGEMLISRVDLFRVLIGANTSTTVSTQPAQNQTRFYSVADYTALASPRPKIVAIKVGIISRSENPVNSGIASADQVFNVLDLSGLKLSSGSGTSTNYQRDVIEKTVMVRNARG